MLKSIRRAGLMPPVVLVLLMSCGATFARPHVDAALAADRAAAVDAAVLGELRRQDAVGVAIGVIENGRIVYVKGYGLADREHALPVTTETMFRWASVSKPLTAVAAMQLVQSGKLDLDADVRRYVPEFPDKGARITMRELLDHQGGIVHYENGEVIRTKKAYAQPHPFVDPVVALDTFKESPLVNAPGEKYSYSSYGYILASAVVQRAGGQPYVAQVGARISGPLALTSLQPDYPWAVIAHRAVGYVREHGAITRSSDTDVSWKLGAGGFISDIRDFAGFAAALLNHRLVSAQIEAQMWQPQNLRDGEKTDRGLGFEVDRKGGRLRVSHSGAQEKTRTRLVIYPESGLGAVVMTNSEWADPGSFSTVVFSALQSPATHAGE
ncbi:MAG: serine hydrolase domain-containing protein [Rudaea sp.]